ncbi:hypothetical protein [Spirosoma endophyticum]|uniref:Uncharacterized protein n=1 Tax=Spirosoma endophyticum TaxID=662367 RepID=A0A1I2FDI9_9BACT|nr:hypothetical protein [Spirosoma endophyticum]SFF03063.1 hypothetical protein SAMN05216167_12547 [Spirosoma endophyticum]
MVFARNMVGGSVFAVAIAVLMSFYQYQMGGLQVGMAISLSLIYGIIAFLGRFIIRRAGEEYAETLVDHYLAEDKIADMSA